MRRGRPGRGAAGRGDFNPRTPCGVRRHTECSSNRRRWHFNPRTPCGVRPPSLLPQHSRFHHFNPRTPCGVRPELAEVGEHFPRFQSTHPVWGATHRLQRRAGTWNFNPRTPCGVRHFCLLHVAQNYKHFNPRTPCGVRPPPPPPQWRSVAISIHAPRVGCDAFPKFYRLSREISIHAPRVGCDGKQKYLDRRDDYFNPRTPCGVRQVILT